MMANLVFLEPNKIDAIPFTTSDVIAEYAEVQHHTVTRLVQKHLGDFEEFGQLRFKIEAVKTPGARGTKYEKHYSLNEEQATLLITYLKNTEPVRAFKKELVRQFYAMRTELTKRQMYREQLKPIRRDMTDVIQENPDKGKWSYKLYTDLAYKSSIGKTAAQLRKERNAPKRAAAIDYMTSAEILEVGKAENRVMVLHEMGMGYEQIKAVLMNRQLIGNIA